MTGIGQFINTIQKAFAECGNVTAKAFDDCGKEAQPLAPTKGTGLRITSFGGARSVDAVIYAQTKAQAMGSPIEGTRVRAAVPCEPRPEPRLDRS